MNADGYEDVFITASMNFGFRYAVNSVLLNNLGENFLTASSSLVSSRGETVARPYLDSNSIALVQIDRTHFAKTTKEELKSGVP